MKYGYTAQPSQAQQTEMLTARRASIAAAIAKLNVLRDNLAAIETLLNSADTLNTIDRDELTDEDIAVRECLSTIEDAVFCAVSGL